MIKSSINGPLRSAYLGAFIGCVGFSVCKYQPGVFAKFNRVVIAVFKQGPFHRVKVHWRINDVMVVLDKLTKRDLDVIKTLSTNGKMLLCWLTG